MPEPIDEFFLERIQGHGPTRSDLATEQPSSTAVLDLFDAQLESRHIDFAARWLQAQGNGFYTIGSAGHEANAAVGLLSRPRDPALLHYRSGGFYAGRAKRSAAEGAPAGDSARDVLLSLTSAAADPMSGGRHKVFGHPALGIIPQTSTIASHLPRAVGLALALGSLRPALVDPAWPEDSLVVCSFGDASANHSTAQGALNAAAYLTHRRLDAPLLLVCEDNGIGISTRTPLGWTGLMLEALPGIPYFPVDDGRPDVLLDTVDHALRQVRSSRRPAVLHLRTVRFMGHAGSDAELAYRSPAEIAADYELDPLLATAEYLLARSLLTPSQVVDRYEAMRTRVMTLARAVVTEPRLDDRSEIMRPLVAVNAAPSTPPGDGMVLRSAAWGSRLPEDRGPMTLGQTINAALTDVMVTNPHAIVFGEDVAVKGGVYGITRGLRKRFDGRRVFDTLLDEQTILGTALGTALAGFLPIPEIQYLAYLHNAEDQLRGEAASLQFFSDGQFRNPMVVRIAGLAYQKGFGGHFHNDNSVAVLRDIPGVVLCVPSHPAEASGLLRECVRLAEQEGRVCVFLEPIALYHARDLYEEGDGAWTAAYRAPSAAPAVAGSSSLGVTKSYGDGEDMLLITFGNGVAMSLRAARALAEEGVRCTVLDLRWLAPLPVEDMTAAARLFDRVLVVDETRSSGGVAEGVLAALIDAGHVGLLARVASADTFIPLGPAADQVLLSQSEIVAQARRLMQLPLQRSLHAAGPSDRAPGTLPPRPTPSPPRTTPAPDARQLATIRPEQVHPGPPQETHT